MVRIFFLLATVITMLFFTGNGCFVYLQLDHLLSH